MLGKFVLGFEGASLLDGLRRLLAGCLAGVMIFPALSVYGGGPLARQEVSGFPTRRGGRRDAHDAKAGRYTNTQHMKTDESEEGT